MFKNEGVEGQRPFDTGVYFVTIYLWLYSVKVISTDIYMLECPLDKVE